MDYAEAIDAAVIFITLWTTLKLPTLPCCASTLPCCVLDAAAMDYDAASVPAFLPDAVSSLLPLSPSLSYTLD